VRDAAPEVHGATGGQARQDLGVDADQALEILAELGDLRSAADVAVQQGARHPGALGVVDDAPAVVAPDAVLGARTARVAGLGVAEAEAWMEADTGRAATAC